MTNTRCSNVFGHRFAPVTLQATCVFHRSDCLRKHCTYSMDAVAFKRTLDNLPDGALKRYVSRRGPRITETGR